MPRRAPIFMQNVENIGNITKATFDINECEYLGFKEIMKFK